MTGRAEPWSPDRRAIGVMAVLAGLAIGIASLIFPVAAFRADIGIGMVGVAYSLSALTQIIARLTLGLLSRRISDQAILRAGVATMLGSLFLLLPHVSFTSLSIAWAVHGMSRACFWQGAQLHAVRDAFSSTTALAWLHVGGSVGQLIGPAVAGALVEIDLRFAILAAATASLASLIPTFLLNRYPPLTSPQRSTGGALLRQPGVRASCGAALTAGTWRGLLDSIVPTLLQTAGHSAAAVGSLMSATNASSVAGSAIAGRLHQIRALMVGYTIHTILFGGALAILGFGTSELPVVTAALMGAGLTTGALQTLGPALGALSVDEERRGDVIALQGTARTVALFAMPLTTSAILAVAPITLVFGGIASLVTMTAIAARAKPK